MNLSILVHTFDGYQHLWTGFSQSFSQHWNNPFTPIYFGTDEHTDRLVIIADEVIYSGPGEWSDRLTNLLHKIPTDYVLYMQEDHWLTQPPPDLDRMMEVMTENNLLRLQLSPIVHFYKLTQSGGIHFFDPSSKYLVSHQPSIWKKSFLLDCLRPGETPWVNEYKGTLRWQETQAKRDFVTNRIAIYPCDWYSHKCIKGVVQS